MSRKSLVQVGNCSTQTKYRLSRKLPMTICAWFRSRSQILPQGNLRRPIVRARQRRSCCGSQGLSHSSCFSGLRVSPLAWEVAVERHSFSAGSCNSAQPCTGPWRLLGHIITSTPQRFLKRELYCETISCPLGLDCFLLCGGTRGKLGVQFVLHSTQPYMEWAEWTSV